MKKTILVAAATMFAVASHGATIQLALTGDSSFADALAAYNATHATSYVDSDGGASLGANDVEVSGAYTLTLSKALGSWTGNLVVKSGATVYGVSDDTSYANVLGAVVSGTTTNGQVFVESGASLQLRTNANNNDRKLARPVHIAGIGVGGKGALQLSTTTNIRAMYPKYIHLDADAWLCRLGNDDKLNGGTVINGSSYLILNGHVLTVTKADAAITLVFENPYILEPGNAGGLVVSNGCVFTMRENTNWRGSEGNTLWVRDNGRLNSQQNFPSVPWSLYYDTTSAFDPGAYQNWTRDEAGSVRCWVGPTTLARTFRINDGSAYSYQNGFRGKVSGPGAISLNSSTTGYEKWFHLESGENDFTGGFAATNFLVRLKSPTAVPSGVGAGPMTIKDCDIDLNYVYPASEFAFPATMFDGSGKLYSKSHANAGTPHAGRFASLVKMGTGTLDVQARLTGGSIDVRGGIVKLARALSESEQLRTDAGVVYGQSAKFECFANPFGNTASADIGWGNLPMKDVVPYILYTNSNQSAITIFSHPHGSFSDYSNPWKGNFYQKLTTYSGWLWNTSSVPKTVKVVCTLNAYVKLTVGESAFSTGEPSRNMKPGSLINPKGSWEVTVQPGANRFEVRAYDRYGLCGNMEGENYFCYGNVCTNGLRNWDDEHGLVWSANTSSTDLNDFHRFEDPGTDLLLTRVAVVEDAFQRLDSLAGSGTLDLDGGVLKAGSVDLSQGLSIVNGRLEDFSLTVTDSTRPLFIDSLSGTVTVDVAPGAEKRRAQVPGLYFGSSGQIQHFVNVFGYEGTDKLYPGTDLTDKEFTTTHTLTNDNGTAYQLSPSIFYREVKDWNTGYLFQTWDGWIWNNTRETKIFKLVNTLNAHTRLQIGATLVWNGQAEATASRVTPWTPESTTLYSPFGGEIELKPGATRFTVKIFDQYGLNNFLRGNVRTNALENWEDASGLMMSENLSSVSYGDFEKLIDDGDGLVFTRELPNAFPCISGRGVTLDLNGHENATCLLNGTVKATNGSLVVDGIWNLDKNEIQDPDVFATGLAFIDSSRLVISGTTLQELFDEMPRGGYLLATGVTGRPQFDKDPNVKIALVVKHGNLYLGSTPGCVLLFR